MSDFSPKSMGLFLFLKVCYLLNPELAFSKEAQGLDLGISKLLSNERALYAHYCLAWRLSRSCLAFLRGRRLVFHD